jgi:hypothetical protein
MYTHISEWRTIRDHRTFQDTPVIASSSSVALHDSPSHHRHPHRLTRTSAVGCIPTDMETVT